MNYAYEILSDPAQKKAYDEQGRLPGKPRQVKGNDVGIQLNIDFKRAMFGGREIFTISHLDTCEFCGGTGWDSYFTTLARPCSHCDGKGIQAFAKQVCINIPAGVNDGDEFLVRGNGDAGINGAAPGDLYVELRIRRDDNFDRYERGEGDPEMSYIDAGRPLSHYFKANKEGTSTLSGGSTWKFLSKSSSQRRFLAPNEYEMMPKEPIINLQTPRYLEDQQGDYF